LWSRNCTAILKKARRKGRNGSSNFDGVLMANDTRARKSRRNAKTTKMNLAQHIQKGASHWNEFVQTFDGEVFDFSNLVLEGGKYDLIEYEFPLPVSFIDGICKGTLHIENAKFQGWVDFTGSKFSRGILIENSVFEAELILESTRCKNGVMIDKCEFSGRVNFDDFDSFGRFRISDSVFHEDASFNEFGAYYGFVMSASRFNKGVTFAGQFHREALFIDNRFEGPVDFNYAHFRAPLYLRGNEFKSRPAIDNIDLNYEPFMPSDQGYGVPYYYPLWLRRLAVVGKWVPESVASMLFIAKADEQYPALRQFRLFAKEYDDHRLALDIYALELKSRRIWYEPVCSRAFIVG
jgi:hypothetical protein